MKNDKMLESDSGTIYLDDDTPFESVQIDKIPDEERVILVDNRANNEKRLSAEKELHEIKSAERKEEKINKILSKMPKAKEGPDEDQRNEEPHLPPIVEDKEVVEETPVVDSILDAVRDHFNDKHDAEERSKNEAEMISDIIDFSNIFESSSEDIEGDSEEAVAAREKKTAKKVDIKALNVIKTNELEKERDLKVALYGNKAAFQIVASQSGYMAKIVPLVSKDIFNILNSSLSRYEYRKEVYKIIYQKIIEFSCGKLGFDDFLKMTSVEDAETLYYGLYCSTFPNSGSFTFTCPFCGEENVFQINHNSLVTTVNTDEMKALIAEITQNARSLESTKEYSLIGKNEAFQLSDSGIICDVRTPSLYDSLELLRTTPENVIDRDAISVTNMLYIDKILIPSRNGSSYTPETDRARILKIIDMLSLDDSMELQNAISDRLDQHRITYSIKNLVCPKCKKKVEEVPLNLEDILFTAIYAKVQ